MGLEHATVINLETGEAVEVLFNPSEYRLRKENAFAQAAVPGLSSPLLQFVNGSLATLTMELFFDTKEQHRHGDRLVNRAHTDVRRLTRPVVSLMEIDPNTHAPPRVSFAWGQLVFTCVLASVSQRFTMFDDTGVPVRAQLEVTFAEYVNEADEARQVKRETADYSRLHTISQGETLSTIAWRMYGDPRKWRPIAIANELAAPRLLRAGTVLRVPALPYRDPATGRVLA
jgi:contractile injection system tube protein/LysM domain-containing protein